MMKRWWNGDSSAKIVKVGGRRMIVTDQEQKQPAPVRFWLRNWQWILTFGLSALAVIAAFMAI